VSLFLASLHNVSFPSSHCFPCWTCFLLLPSSSSCSALFAKTFRIYKLFANSEYKIVAIYNWQLLVAVFVLELILIIILAVWTAPQFRPSPTLDLASNGIEFVIKCDGDNYKVFVGVISAYYLVLAVVGLVLAFLTRNIHTIFNESVWIGYSCFCLIVVAVITPIQFLIDSDPTPGM
jgi:7 transmembrane sweet-taste receptor of 3 GCPR